MSVLFTIYNFLAFYEFDNLQKTDQSDLRREDFARGCCAKDGGVLFHPTNMSLSLTSIVDFNFPFSAISSGRHINNSRLRRRRRNVYAARDLVTAGSGIMAGRRARHVTPHEGSKTAGLSLSRSAWSLPKGSKLSPLPVSTTDRKIEALISSDIELGLLPIPGVVCPG